jgi:hypothetical protein
MVDKEFWADPKRNRRNSPGRRESDYSVCSFHELHEKQNDADKVHFCDKVRTLRHEHDEDVKALRGEHDADIVRVNERIEHMTGRIVGWRAMGMLVTIFIAMFALFGTISINMFNSIKAELTTVESAITDIKKELQR